MASRSLKRRTSPPPATAGDIVLVATWESSNEKGSHRNGSLRLASSARTRLPLAAGGRARLRLRSRRGGSTLPTREVSLLDIEGDHVRAGRVLRRDRLIETDLRSRFHLPAQWGVEH